MQNTFRDGVDLELTFKSQMRRLAASPFPLSDNASLGDSRDNDNVRAAEAQPDSRDNDNVRAAEAQPLDCAPDRDASRSLYSKVRKLLHSPRLVLVGRIKAMLHPILSRLRRYLAVSIQQEMQTLRAGLQDDTQTLRAGLQDDLQTLRAGLQHEIRTRVAELAARLKRPLVLYCGPEEVLVRSDVGYVLCSPRDFALLTCLLEGERGRGTRLMIQRFLKPGDVFIDVGANIGLHTLAAARAMRGVGRIVAIEPREPTRRLLEKAVALNGFSGIVEIHQAAGSSQTGRQQLLLGGPSGHHGLFSLPVPADTHRPPVDVTSVNLDEIIASNAVVNLIKIDAHGTELDVLEGSKSLIRQNQKVALMVKFEPAYLRRTGYTTRDWLSRFDALGFAHRIIDNETGVLESWLPEKLEQMESVNLLFARPGVVLHKAEMCR